MKRCGLCGASLDEGAAFRDHMISVHGWSSEPAPARRRSIGRGCATIAFAVLLIYGVGMIGQTILPLSPGIRGNEMSYLVISSVFLLLAGAVWALWLRPPRGGTKAAPSRPGRPSPLAALMDHASRPDETSTNYLQWPWLIRLDLAFRDHLWVRITTLLVGMIAVTLVVMLAFGAGILR